jgi:hypothetical protein
MINSVSDKVYENIELLLEQVVEALDNHDLEQADILLAKASKYRHAFDEEQEDYYEWAMGIVSNEDYFYEPTEYDEWQSFDSDC